VLAYLVLPTAALYTELRERGWSEPSAVDAVTRALGVVLVRAERPPIGLLSRIALGRQALVQGTANFAAWAPRLVGASCDVTLVERTPTRMAIDVTRCYVLDTLRLLDAAPAVAAMCAHDTAAYAGTCPRIRFTRTGTSGTGADRCDFCLEILPRDRHPGCASQPDSHLSAHCSRATGSRPRQRPAARSERALLPQRVRFAAPAVSCGSPACSPGYVFDCEAGLRTGVSGGGTPVLDERHGRPAQCLPGRRSRRGCGSHRGEPTTYL
jgi:hypothetical protein